MGDQGFFSPPLRGGGGLTPLLFSVPPDQFELVTPRGVIKSRIDAEAAPNISSDVTYAAVAALFGIPETELNCQWQFLRRLPAHGFVD